MEVEFQSVEVPCRYDNLELPVFVVVIVVLVGDGDGFVVSHVWQVHVIRYDDLVQVDELHFYDLDRLAAS